MTRPIRPTLLALLMFASVGSGCAALLNQILWTRILSLVFGSTIESVSVVTAIFMAGLALGSAVAPSLVRERGVAATVSLYTKIELAMGISGMLLAFALPALESARARLGAFPVWAIAIALLLVPTTLMGTTLVIQAHALSAGQDGSRSSRSSGLLFAANTTGAVLGAYGSVLFLIPALGIRNSIFLATALNGASALLAFGAGRSITGAASALDRPAGSSEPKTARRKSLRSAAPEAVGRDVANLVDHSGSRVAAGVMMLAIFTTGFAGLANEVAWTRAFILIAGPTVHAFAFVLGAIVLGLAAGAFVSSGLLLALPNPRLVFALTQSALALACALVIRSLAQMPLLYGEDVRRLVDAPASLIDLQAWRALSLLFPAAALSGALFPLGLRLLGSRFTSTESMGRGSALNTAGAIGGAILSGFFLLPGIGLDATLRVAALASAFSAVAISIHGRPFSRIAGALTGALVAVIVLQTPAFDKDLFAGGVYKYSVYDTNLSVEDVLRRGELVSYAEGRVANVSVKRVGATFSLAVDGKVDATSGGDMLTQRLLAHVPILLNAHPKTALVIGLGSGVTAGAAISHGLQTVTAVEISPDVVDAARRFFSDANGRVLESPRLRLVIGDARQHVLATTDRYDVVISEPSNPWMAGVSSLFTREFFRSVKRHLAEGGIFCQWGHLYNMGEDDLATLLGTFRGVFPNAVVFVISEADILIVGADRPPVFDSARLGEVREEARHDLVASNVLPAMLAFIPAVSLAALDPWLREARPHTDDRPVLDFSAPLSIHAQTATSNRRRLIPTEATPSLTAVKARLALLEAAGSAEWSYDLSEGAIDAGVADLAVARAFVESAIRLHRVESAEATLTTAVGRSPSAPLLVARALLYWNTNRADLALPSLEAASRLDPREASAYRLAAEVQSAANNLQAMRKLVARALALNHTDAEAIALAAEAELKDGRLEPAARLSAGALGFDPNESRALEVQALALAQLGRGAEARTTFERLLRAAPDAPTSRNNFGVFELQQGNPSSALRLFKDAVDLDPLNLDAYRGLKEAATALGRVDVVQSADRGIARLSR